MLNEVDTRLTNYWWALMLRGMVAIIFGVAAVFWPGLTLTTLVYLFGAFVLFNGVLGVIIGVMDIKIKDSMWYLTLLLGFIELGVGVYMLRHPNVTFAVVVLIIGLILVARGVIEGVSSLFDKALSSTEKTLYVMVSVLTLAVGVFIMLQPKASGVAFVWILGVYALITGPLMIALSLDGRRLQAEVRADVKQLKSSSRSR